MCSANTPIRLIGAATALAFLIATPSLASAKFYQRTETKACGESSCSLTLLFVGRNEQLIVKTASCTIQVDGPQGLREAMLFADDSQQDHFYPEPINRFGDTQAFAFNTPTTFVAVGPKSPTSPSVGVGMYVVSNGDPITSLTCRIAGKLGRTE